MKVQRKKCVILNTGDFEYINSDHESTQIRECAITSNHEMMKVLPGGVDPLVLVPTLETQAPVKTQCDENCQSVFS